MLERLGRPDTLSMMEWGYKIPCQMKPFPWLMQAISGVLKLLWALSSWCHWSTLPFPNFLGSVWNFIFKSAINHGAEVEMSPSAIKAAEQSLLSPVSIVHHGLTSGIRKLPDVLTLLLLAPAGILTASICMGEKTSGKQLSLSFYLHSSKQQELLSQSL